MVAPLVRTQLETVMKETRNGTHYSVRNLSKLGYNYLVIDLMGDREYELVSASCIIASENYAHRGHLSTEWEGTPGEWYHTYLWSSHFTNMEPFALNRTIRFSGPCRLVFGTRLTGNNLAYFNAFIRTVEPVAETSRGGWGQW